MSQNPRSLLHQHSVYAWITVGTAAILLIPLIAMQFTTEVDWSPVDFVVMGALLFGAASIFVTVARRINRENRLVVGVILAAAFLYIWAELAVGIFTDIGS